MKKKQIRILFAKKGFKQMLRKMKLTAVLIFAMFLTGWGTSLSQTKLTMNLRDAPIKELIREIEGQTDYYFLYEDDVLRSDQKITIQADGATLESVLNRMCDQASLHYKILDLQIVLLPNDREENPEAIKTQIEQQPQQKKQVSGEVRDSRGQPIPGVTVYVKGATTGTTTDAEGNFSLQIPVDAKILAFSFVGLKTQEIPVGTTSVFKVVMVSEEQALDEVIVIGYGTTTRRLNTGSISSIKSKQVELRPVNNVMQALQGQVSGVAITNFSPGIGSPLKVLIRGTNSITSGTNPLIIIDGVIVNENPGDLIVSSVSYISSGGSGSNTYQQGNSVLNSINPNDIESIDILKDADATSIYGSRGTNGVILITTKKAAAGKTTVTINASTGWKTAIGLTPRMNTEQYLKLRRDAFATGNITGNGKMGADGNPDPAGITSVINPITPTNMNAPDLTLWSQTAYTDYTAFELGNPAPNYNFDASITGGNKGANYLASAGYYRMYDTYMFKPYQERLTSRMQINSASADNRFNLRLGAIVGIENQKFTQTNFSTVTGQANANPPNFEMTNPDGTWNFGVDKGYITGLYYNPLPNEYLDIRSKTNNLMLNGEMSYEILKGLVAKIQASYNVQANEYQFLYPTKAVNVQNRYNTVPLGTFTTNRFTSLNTEPQLAYSRTISKATVSALAGATFLDKKIARTAVDVSNPGSDDLLRSWSSGKPTSTASDNAYEKFQSLFGRLNIDWDKKYIANFTFRRDGSSRFSPKNRYANFGSAGLAWIFSGESFIKEKLPFLSHGKLRGSFGTTGNNNIGNYLYLGLLQASSSTLTGSYANQNNKTLNLANYPNEGIRWESTAKTDAGFELGFFKNRIMITGTWYRTLSDNLLVGIPLPIQTGYSSYTGNFEGVVQNTGQELELTTQNFGPESPVAWSTRFNVTHNENLLKEFPGIEKTTYATTYKVGRALPGPFLQNSLEFPMRLTGIDPATGLPQFKDANGDGVVNWSDMGRNESWNGTSQPTVWGGLNNTISYKGFTLDVFVQYSNGIFTKWNFYESNPIGSMFNPAEDVVDNYWMKPGDVKKYPRLFTRVPGTSAYTNFLTSFYPYCDDLMYKGYYVRLKNVRLTYTLPAAWSAKAGLGRASVYVTGENLAVYTAEKLYKDPEVFWGRGAGLLRTITTGVRIEF